MSAGRVWTLGCLGHRGLKIVDWGLSWAGRHHVAGALPLLFSSQGAQTALLCCLLAGRQAVSFGVLMV